MDFEQAERRFRDLDRKHRSGKLDDTAFQIEVAKLLLRDGQGVFWMLDADSGAWFCNSGEGWVPGDPRASQPSQPAASIGLPARRRGTRRLMLWGAVLVIVAGVVGFLAWQQGWIRAWPRAQSTPLPSADVRVNIASPASGSQVALGQVVAVESTIDASPDLQAVARVELQVNGQAVDTQMVQPLIQPGQKSLPLSQLWWPKVVGEQQLVVIALSDIGETLGQAAVTLHVAERTEGALPEPACTHDAALVAGVSVPSGTAFSAGVQVDKTWHVSNRGTCAWGVGYELVRLEGEEMGAPEAIPIPPTSAGERVDLTVTFWAPDEVGTYASLWQLRSPDGQLFGPTLPVTIRVEILTEQNLPPVPPAELRALVVQGDKAVQLTWLDRSDNEDAFRIYREDVEASIGLVPANDEMFLDPGVACGHTYRYAVVAFNAAGTSPISQTVEATLPPCAPADEPPTLILTVVPSQVLPGETFTITFEASDDLGVSLVVVWGEDTGEPTLDAGRIFTCTEVLCTATWPLTWTQEISALLTLVALARDSSGQESEPARTVVLVLPPE